MISCHPTLAPSVRRGGGISTFLTITWNGSLGKMDAPFLSSEWGKQKGKATRKLENKGRLQTPKRYSEFLLESKSKANTCRDLGVKRKLHGVCLVSEAI